MNKKEVIREINDDIVNKVYTQFPVLKAHLVAIKKKLHDSIYIINSPKKPLNQAEMNTLRSNDYIGKSKSKSKSKY